MNWALASGIPVIIGVIFKASGLIHPAIAVYHLVCVVAVCRCRTRLRLFIRWDRSTLRWALGTTAVIVTVLLIAPLVLDPAPYRGLFRRMLLPGSRPELLFALFAVYTLVVHVPLEELFWRGVVMDPAYTPVGTAIIGNAIFFCLVHAVPLAMILGPRGFLLAAPSAAAGAVWAYVAIRSGSLWPGLVSHWGADVVILGEMWFCFIR